MVNHVDAKFLDKHIINIARKERMKRMTVPEHGPFSVRPCMTGYWGVYDCLGREYITHIFDDKVNLTQENATFICNALNLYTRAALLDGS